MRKLIVLLAVAVSGCATPMQWQKAGATNEEFFKDGAECRYEAAKAVAGASVDVTSGVAVYAAQQRQFELERMCMHLRGYRIVPANS